MNTKLSNQRRESVEMCFYRMMLIIPWSRHVRNDEALERSGTKRILVLNIRKRVEISRVHT